MITNGVSRNHGSAKEVTLLQGKCHGGEDWEDEEALIHGRRCSAVTKTQSGPKIECD